MNDFKVDPEEYITDRVLLHQALKRQEELSNVVQEHMRTEDIRWSQINIKLAVIGVVLTLLLFGVDLSPVAGAIAGMVGG